MTLPNILGKEFVCINKIIKKLPVQSIGDDCAVLDFGGKKLLVTVDTFSDKVHFDKKYFSLKEIGQRCAEAAVSDIAAMGGEPLYMVLAIATPEHAQIPSLIDGIKKSLLRHRITMVGGDTTYSSILSLSITVFGSCKRPIKRNGAKINDAIYISGPTGLSMAGLYAIKKGIKSFKILEQAHKNPKAKIAEGIKAAKHANSMIDISDGLVSELYHISHQSEVSIELDNIPIHKELARLCKVQDLDPLAFALYGGEDYQLLITGQEKHLSMVKGLIKIGRVVGKSTKALVCLNKNGKTTTLNTLKGFKHF